MFEKGVTTELIGKYLKKFGWEKFQQLPEPGEKEGMILTGWDGHAMFIDPWVEKGTLKMTVRSVLKAPPDATAADHLNGLLLALSVLNYKMIIGSWGFDPSDGEVVFKVALPIDSGKLEYEDFQHVLLVVVMSVEAEGRALGAILDGTKTAQEVIDSF